jgi:RimJ/RimL family protein N-acetyltransferase
MKWLEVRLERAPSEPFYFFESNHIEIGMCRLDLIIGTPDKYEISILVDPDQHGKGAGRKILDMSCESFFNMHPDKSILAKVHKENIVSKKLFENAGFILRIPVCDFLFLDKYLIRSSPPGISGATVTIAIKSSAAEIT